jgi:hypothetical protein
VFLGTAVTNTVVSKNEIRSRINVGNTFDSVPKIITSDFS